jgi:putative hydrolase of HD superfamily
VERGIIAPESVVAHTCGTALLALFLAPEQDDVDADRAVKLALIHDIHESVSGDIAKKDDMSDDEIADKQAQEHSGYEQLMELMPDRFNRDEVQALWQTYEERDGRTARFVKDLDLLDMVMQAYIYVKQERYGDAEQFHQETDSMDEFFDYALPKFQFDATQQFAEEIHDAYLAEQDR